MWAGCTWTLPRTRSCYRWMRSLRSKELDRTALILPIQRRLPERTRAHVRHGTSTWFAALEIAPGTVTAVCEKWHWHTKFWRSSSRSSAPTPTKSCTWSWTTTPLSSTEDVARRKTPAHSPSHPGPRSDEPRRGLVRHHRTPSHPPRHRQICTRPERQNPSLHQRLERALPRIRVDQTADEIPGRPTVKRLQRGPLLDAQMIKDLRQSDSHQLP